MTEHYPGLATLVRQDWQQFMVLTGQPGPPLRFWRLLSPRFLPVVLLRLSNMLGRKRLGPLAKLVSLFNFVLFGIEVPASLEIGGGLVLPHTIGTVLGARRIGNNVTIFHQVTLGAVAADFAYDPAKRPLVEDDVTIGVGAKVLGNVVLGRGCNIGANAVVLQSVPPGATAVGIPARIVASSPS
jgi:serine O-acetyltransferase